MIEDIKEEMEHIKNLESEDPGIEDVRPKDLEVGIFSYILNVTHITIS